MIDVASNDFMKDVDNGLFDALENPLHAVYACDIDSRFMIGRRED
jgi:hypothetical protein